MDIKCKLVEGIGKKSNKPYMALEIQLTDTLKKTVFLEPAELELLKMKKQNSNNENQIDNEFWNN